MFYKSISHQKRYQHYLMKDSLENKHLHRASIYLLSSTKELWEASRNHISNKKIYFEKIVLKNASTETHTALRIAQDLYMSTSHLILKDFCYKSIVSNDNLELFITAIKIARGKEIA